MNFRNSSFTRLYATGSQLGELSHRLNQLFMSAVLSGRDSSPSFIIQPPLVKKFHDNFVCRCSFPPIFSAEILPSCGDRAAHGVAKLHLTRKDPDKGDAQHGEGVVFFHVINKPGWGGVPAPCIHSPLNFDGDQSSSAGPSSSSSGLSSNSSSQSSSSKPFSLFGRRFGTIPACHSSSPS